MPGSIFPIHQGKSGGIDEAKQTFQSISEPTAVTFNCMSECCVDHYGEVQMRSLCAYSFLVNAYTRNGMGSDAIALYRQMSEKMHDAVSHVCVLNACSHSGLVDEAQANFNEIDMKSERIHCTMVS
jgi:pentatricopeptide repeat protein